MDLRLVLTIGLAMSLWGCPDVDTYTEDDLGGAQAESATGVQGTTGRNTPQAAMTSSSADATDANMPLAGMSGGSDVGAGGLAIDETSGGSVGGSMGGSDEAMGGATSVNDASGGNEDGSAGGMAGEDTIVESECDYVLEVALPANTPAGDTIYVAGSFDSQDWIPDAYPMTRSGNTARIEIPLRQGQELQYKYTRGTWESVEVLNDCGERDNRNVLVTCAAGERSDTVAAWTDICP